MKEIFTDLNNIGTMADSIEKEIAAIKVLKSDLENKLRSLNTSDLIIKEIDSLPTDEVAKIYNAILDSHHSSHLEKFN